MKETIETIVHQFPLVLKWQQPNKPAVVRVINIKQNYKKRLRENQLSAGLFCIFIKNNEYLVHTVLYFTFDNNFLSIIQFLLYFLPENRC